MTTRYAALAPVACYFCPMEVQEREDIVFVGKGAFECMTI